MLAALLVALTVSGCSGADDSGSAGDDPAPAPSSSTPPTDGASEPAGEQTSLTADPAAAARCAVPTPDLVAGNDLAFDGVVESIDDGLVTLRPTAVYAGEPTDTVTVQSPSEDLQALLAAVTFEQGGRFLVAATDGQLALCTVSAPWSPELADIYAQAFGTPQ